MSPEAEHHALLQDPDVHRWYTLLSEEAREAAEKYLHALAQFCEEVGHTPEELARLPADLREDLLGDAGTRRPAHAFAESQHEVTKQAVASWIAFHTIR